MWTKCIIELYYMFRIVELCEILVNPCDLILWISNHMLTSNLNEPYVFEMIDLWQYDVYTCFTHYKNFLIIETMWTFELIDVNHFLDFKPLIIWASSQS